MEDNKFAQTKSGEEIKVDMYVNTHSEKDNTRPSSTRLKVVGIELCEKYPWLSSITLEDGETYTSAYLYYPRYKK